MRWGSETPNEAPKGIYIFPTLCAERALPVNVSLGPNLGVGTLSFGYLEAFYMMRNTRNHGTYVSVCAPPEG